MEIDFSEINALSVDLGQNASRLGSEVSKVVRRAGMATVRDAKLFAPVDTGNLRNSIGMDIEGDGRGAVMRAVVGPTASYGRYVEEGTSRMAPHAYLGPAFDRQVPDFVAGLAAIVEDAL